MRLIHTSATAVAVLGIALAPAYADQHGKTAHGPSTHASSPHAPAKTTTTTTSPKHTTSSPKHTATTTSTKTHGSPKKSAATASTTTSNTGTTPGTTTGTTTVSPIAQKIQSKPQLASRVNTMLQGTGMTMSQASAGFKNQGQFIAALHVAQNHPGIKFTDLRTEMVDNHLSLGQSIKKLRPTVDATTVATHAEHEAEHDIASTSPRTAHK